MSNGLEILGVFPEIEGLGQVVIQQLCDSWRATPLAREFAVSKLIVDDQLRLTFECQLTHKIQNGEAYFFPMDALLLYLADNGQLSQSERGTVKQRIVAAREHGGPDVFRRFKIQPGPKLPLFVTCPKCRNVMQTQLTAYRTEQIRFDPEDIECPKCRGLFTIDGSQLHFEPGV